jgi:hypothetical protein
MIAPRSLETIDPALHLGEASLAPALVFGQGTNRLLAMSLSGSA